MEVSITNILINYFSNFTYSFVYRLAFCSLLKSFVLIAGFGTILLNYCLRFELQKRIFIRLISLLKKTKMINPFVMF